MSTVDFFVTPVYNVFTFDEAIEYMKMRDKYITAGPPIRWRNVYTKQEVIIGYSGYADKRSVAREMPKVQMPTNK